MYFLTGLAILLCGGLLNEPWLIDLACFTWLAGLIGWIWNDGQEEKDR